MDSRWVDGQASQSNYYVTVILRLVFNDERGLAGGELINTDGTLQKQFRELEGLLDAVASLVNRHIT
jgi:hypothetical protein